MDEPEIPPRRNLAARALTFAAAVAIGWAIVYAAVRYFASGWRV